MLYFSRGGKQKINSLTVLRYAFFNWASISQFYYHSACFMGVVFLLEILKIPHNTGKKCG
jgi:hypothetical protein